MCRPPQHFLLLYAQVHYNDYSHDSGMLSSSAGWIGRLQTIFDRCCDDDLDNDDVMGMVVVQLQLLMNRQQQVQAFEEAQEYLQMHDVYGLLGQLLQQVVQEKPTNVLDFLISKLEAPEKFTLFVVGPPGLSINNAIRKALTEGGQQLDVLNCGEEIGRAQKSFGQEEKRCFQSCLLLPDQSIGTVVARVKTLCHGERSCIIEGFPKSLRQAHLLQEHRLSPKNLLIINVDDAGLEKLVDDKVAQLNPGLPVQQRAQMVAAAKMEHQVNLAALKNFYNKYLEIDLSRDRSEAFVISQLHKAFNTQTLARVPRVSSQVVVVGAPFSGRTALGKKLAEHYGFVYISTSELIAEQVRRDTVHGRRVRAQFQQRQLVDDFLVEKLIEERTARKDCRMQGFVLEGYPKNQAQLENLKNMKLSPTLVVALDAPLDLLQSRTTDTDALVRRYEKWSAFATHLRATKEKVFWANPHLTVGNLYEEVVHEFEKRFL